MSQVTYNLECLTVKSNSGAIRSFKEENRVAYPEALLTEVLELLDGLPMPQSSKRHIRRPTPTLISTCGTLPPKALLNSPAPARTVEITSTSTKRYQIQMPFLSKFSRTLQVDTKDLSLNVSTLADWAAEVEANPTLSLAGTVARNANVDEVLIKRDRKAQMSVNAFSHEVTPQGSPRTNQKSSGRCWLFAATNCLRIPIQRKYNIESFQLSQPYLFFWDKLEKANFFLEQIIDTASEPIDSRIVQHLLSGPVSDGGQWGMFANIVEKYGIVPIEVYPEDDNTVRSSQVNRLVTSLLREYAQKLRDAVKAEEPEDKIRDLQRSQIKHIHQLLVIFFGAPPGPDDEFTWEFTNKDGKYSSVTTTPRKFYKEIVNLDAKQSISLLHDPRNEYDRAVHIDRLGNVVGAPEVVYLNKDIGYLVNKAIERIKSNKPVFFGTHTPIYHDDVTGIIDTELWSYEKIGYAPTQSKADRLRYQESQMTHAMAFTGVQLDNKGRPVRWKVENSWGETKGNKGFYVMSHEFFSEYVYQVVIDRSEASKADLAALEKEPILLPPWDPCGALAN